MPHGETGIRHGSRGYWRNYDRGEQEVPQPSQAINETPHQEGASFNAKKRERSDSPSEVQRESTRVRITDADLGPVNAAGNRLLFDVTWLEQKDDRANPGNVAGKRI